MTTNPTLTRIADILTDKLGRHLASATSAELEAAARAVMAPDAGSDAGQGGWRDITSLPGEGVVFQAFVQNIESRQLFWEPRCIVDGHGEFRVWGRVDYDEEGWVFDPQITPVCWQHHPIPPLPDEAGG